MTLLALCQTVLPLGHGQTPSDTVTLDYESRLMRRKRIEADGGTAFMLDLAEVTNLLPGQALQLDDGRVIAIAAAEEPVVVIRGDNLLRLAWHIGNRHTPCQVAGDHLVVRRDPVLEAMLTQLGASLTPKMLPFHPEGGAYGHGRTMGHAH
ncbi:urease accessory protein UreE [Pseudorhodobacter aquimaris]|uniref:urease accessory protein UreE n=1 Tax=Pseudorhodobacter aquimaris TaxID=687412 RepID=UPI00067E1AAA|nr:urease accessory protein UreE [Pseudorhodobacter aquimaris]